MKKDNDPPVWKKHILYPIIVGAVLAVFIGSLGTFYLWWGNYNVMRTEDRMNEEIHTIKIERDNINSEKEAINRDLNHEQQLNIELNNENRQLRDENRIIRDSISSIEKKIDKLNSRVVELNEYDSKELFDNTFILSVSKIANRDSTQYSEFGTKTVDTKLMYIGSNVKYQNEWDSGLLMISNTLSVNIDDMWYVVMLLNINSEKRTLKYSHYITKKKPVN